MSTAPQPVATKADVLRILREQRKRIRALGAHRIGLFGSFVRGEQHETSDVDVLVASREGEPTFDHFMEMCFILEDASGRKVEVVTENLLSPYIGPISCARSNMSVSTIERLRHIRDEIEMGDPRDG